jgi:hypothetical protein
MREIVEDFRGLTNLRDSKDSLLTTIFEALFSVLELSTPTVSGDLSNLSREQQLHRAYLTSTST